MPDRPRVAVAVDEKRPRTNVESTLNKQRRKIGPGAVTAVTSSNVPTVNPAPLLSLSLAGRERRERKGGGGKKGDKGRKRVRAGHFVSCVFTE